MTTILIKKKDTAGAPAAGDLTNAAGGAEIAVNTATKRLYTKDAAGNVVELCTNASASTIADLTVTNTLTVSGTVTSNLKFTDNTYDIGASGATRPRNYYGAGAITAAGLIRSDSGSIGFLAYQASSVGYTGYRIYNDQNAISRALEIDYAGSAYANPLLTGGTAGESGSIATTGAYPLYLGSNNTVRMYFGGAGNIYATTNLYFSADATYDIGASGATRPRNLYLGGTVAALNNSASVGLTLASTTGEATLVLDAATTGTNNSNKIDFRSNGATRWVLGGGNTGPNGDYDFTLFNYVSSATVMNVPSGGINIYFPGKLAVFGASAANQPVTVQADTNGHSLWTINDATLNYGQIYFGGSASSGFQGIRADGRTGGWLDIITQDTRRMRFNADGSAAFYNGVLTFDAAYPFFNNIASGSVKTIASLNMSGTYYSALFDSGGVGAAGSKIYFSRTTTQGGAYVSALQTWDFQNSRIGINNASPSYELDVRGPDGAGTAAIRVRSVTSGAAGLILDSAINTGGTATQISFNLAGTGKWALGYANVGAGGANDFSAYNYIAADTPWILTSTSYQRLPRTAAFVATVGTNYTSTGTSIVKFDTVVTDNRSNFDTANYRFIAPVDGYYQFNVTVNQYSVTIGTVFEIGFRKNGGAYAGTRIVSASTSDQNISSSMAIYLGAGDNVDVQSYTAGGFSASVRWNVFSGHLIG